MTAKADNLMTQETSELYALTVDSYTWMKPYKYWK